MSFYRRRRARTVDIDPTGEGCAGRKKGSGVFSQKQCLSTFEPRSGETTPDALFLREEIFEAQAFEGFVGALDGGGKIIRLRIGWGFGDDGLK